MKKLWALTPVAATAAPPAATAAVGVRGNAAMNGRMLMMKSILRRMKELMPTISIIIHSFTTGPLK